MVKTIRRKVSTNSIFRQLVIDSLIISIIPIAVGAIIIFRLFFGMSREIEMASYEQVVAQYMFDINEKFTQADARLKHLSVDNNIIKGLIGGKGKSNPITAGSDISMELIKILQLDTTLDYYNCMIYSVVNEVPVVGRGVTSISEADLEKHTFTYSLYPHMGEWKNAGVYQESFNINVPLRAVCGGAAGENFSLMSVNAENVILETIKLAEDGEGIVVRLNGTLVVIEGTCPILLTLSPLNV